MKMASNRSTWEDAVDRLGTTPVQMESREDGYNDQVEN